MTGLQLEIYKSKIDSYARKCKDDIEFYRGQVALYTQKVESFMAASKVEIPELETPKLELPELDIPDISTIDLSEGGVEIKTMESLLIKALENTEPFLVYDNKLYKKFDRITIEPVLKEKRPIFGLFNAEPEQVYSGVEIKFWYGETLAMERSFPPIYFEQDDRIHLLETSGLTPVSITIDD